MKKYLFILSAIVLIYACKDEKTAEQTNIVEDSTYFNLADTNIHRVKEIFFSLPSPIETAKIIEQTKVNFTNGALFPLEKSFLYETSTDQVILLGIYSADLCYLTMFNEQQLSAEYMIECKSLLDKLGIYSILNDSTINYLQNSLNDKNEVIKILSEQLVKVNAYLAENERNIYATLIVYSGWVEGLYLSVMLKDNEETVNEDLSKAIYEQRFALEDIIELMSLYTEIEEINIQLNKLKDLYSIYKKIGPTLNYDEFESLKTKVQEIRNSLAKENTQNNDE